MTNEHLRLLIDEERDLAVLHRAAVSFANAELPEPVLAAVRVGRLVALRKPNGRIRALVVGDVFRPLVVRALSRPGPALRRCLADGLHALPIWPQHSRWH